MVLGHPWGFEHCVSHFARFNCLYSHHPVHPRFWIEDFHEAPRTGEQFLMKPIHGKVSRQSVWGITVPFIGAVTPMHPAPAIVVTPPGGKPPNRVEAQKNISYALTASSVAPVQDQACALELVEFAPETLARDDLPAGHDGSVWKQAHYGLTPHWAARVKEQFGKNPNVDAFNRVLGMAQATCRVSPLHDFFSIPADRPDCIGCALPIISFPSVSGNVGKKNYEPSSWGRSGHIESGGSPLWKLLCKGTTFLGRRLRPLSIKMTTSQPFLNRVAPRWRYTWTVALRRKIWSPLNVMWPPFLASAVPNTDTGMTSEGSRRMKGCRTIWLRCAPSHIKRHIKTSSLPLLLTLPPMILRRNNACVHALQKLRKSYLAGGHYR